MPLHESDAGDSVENKEDATQRSAYFDRQCNVQGWVQAHLQADIVCEFCWKVLEHKRTSGKNKAHTQNAN